MKITQEQAILILHSAYAILFSGEAFTSFRLIDDSFGVVDKEYWLIIEGQCGEEKVFMRFPIDKTINVRGNTLIAEDEFGNILEFIPLMGVDLIRHLSENSLTLIKNNPY